MRTVSLSRSITTATALDCADGIFYCLTEGEKVYTLPYSEGQESVEYAMSAPLTAIDVGDFNYRLTGSALKVANFSDDSILSFEGEYKSLKKFGETVYTVLGNEVYKFAGAESEKLSLSYADYASTQKILAGQAAAKLKEYSAPSLVTVKAGAHMTETELSGFAEGYFITGKTISNAEPVSAALLCITGNAAVIAVGRACYVLNKENIEVNQDSCYSTPEFEYGKITAAGDKIYASPYVSECTAVLSGAAGLTVKVINKVQNEVLDSAFYEIEYTVTEGVALKGYISEKFLIKTEFVKEDDKKPDKVDDPAYTEESNTKTILIIFAVVILVLAAVGYLAFTATGDKRKAKAAKKESKPPENKE